MLQNRKRYRSRAVEQHDTPAAKNEEGSQISLAQDYSLGAPSSGDERSEPVQEMQRPEENDPLTGLDFLQESASTAQWRPALAQAMKIGTGEKRQSHFHDVFADLTDGGHDPPVNLEFSQGFWDSKTGKEMQLPLGDDVVGSASKGNHTRGELVRRISSNRVKEPVRRVLSTPRGQSAWTTSSERRLEANIHLVEGSAMQ